MSASYPCQAWTCSVDQGSQLVSALLAGSEVSVQILWSGHPGWQTVLWTPVAHSVYTPDMASGISHLHCRTASKVGDQSQNRKYWELWSTATSDPLGSWSTWATSRTHGQPIPQSVCLEGSDKKISQLPQEQGSLSLWHNIVAQGVSTLGWSTKSHAHCRLASETARPLAHGNWHLYPTQKSHHLLDSQVLMEK